ncbi:MAG: T9SS type A sorting domain-containing protein [Ignavibacterium sp.]|nr:T9SS type A sorting domain-containing protein [Ignavibacterium sp.]
METTKKLFRTSVIAIVLIFGEAGFSQEYPWSIYPLELGNIWVTRDFWWRPYYRLEIVDSGVVIEGESYFKTKCTYRTIHGSLNESFIYHRITDSEYVIRFDSSGLYVNPKVKYYKVDTQPGDYWQNLTIISGSEIIHYFVVDTSYYLVFGTSTKVREIFVTDSSGYENYTFWSEEFGLLEHYVHDFELGNYIYLRGCVIDGVLYGDTTFLTVGVDDIQTTPVAEYKLFQNYPNPFNPTTTIEYELKEYALVNLKVYDLLGNEVAELINEEKYAGRYSSSFNGNGLSSGVYFYKLTIGGNTQVRKMILMR